MNARRDGSAVQWSALRPGGRTESVQNLYERYRDLGEAFPQELRDDALPYFIDWLLENVHLVEITAYSDDDAYTIFETMNDRGLSLSPTDMLKGYLLANIEEAKRTAANTRWRDRILELNDCWQGGRAGLFQGVAPQPIRHQDPRTQEGRASRGL